MITRKNLIKTYLEFFKSKGHKEIENSSLIPKNDPSVLFTTAGMHPLVPYLLGQPHPLGKKLCSIQKCIRTGDIEEVGDTTHHTFFEMLGNWSLGDYWKKEAVEYSFEFLTKTLKIPKEKIIITCFIGDKDAQKDTETADVWKYLGIKKIKFLGKKDNWWGPAGETGPCGPDTEMFVDNFEIWNDVFMQYNKNQEKKFVQAKQKNIDTGMGVERTLAILKNLEDSYLTELWTPIIKRIEKSSGKKYGENEEITTAMRIIADHIKAAVFILAENIIPSNKEHGYVLRRLIRRALRYSRSLNMKDIGEEIISSIFEIYKEDYNYLIKNKEKIISEFQKEQTKFLQTLEKGLSQFRKLTSDKKQLSGKDVFLLYQSYGFPIEMIEEEAKKTKIKLNKKEFEEELQKHQDLSRTSTEGRFKSGLADHSEATTKLHTATHLILAALKKILKDETITQKGSNITSERLRLDFSFGRKLTQDEIKKTEDLVNEQIKKSLKVTITEMGLEEARKQGATGSFEEKYGEKVFVYQIGNFSKEICAGPHVKNTSELRPIKIVKEESSSSGVRRIKAVFV
jgi:alanyl-tRNA synthetase